jgi:UDP-glucose 4-epimerase
MNVLVVGGAGYIGSHCVRQLQAAGHTPYVLDNLVYGHRAAVANDIPFFDQDLGNRDAVAKILVENKIEVVMHFAAFINVGESVNVPLKYYENNVGNTIQLLLAMTRLLINLCHLRRARHPSTSRRPPPSTDQPIRGHQATRRTHPTGSRSLG